MSSLKYQRAPVAEFVLHIWIQVQLDGPRTSQVVSFEIDCTLTDWVRRAKIDEGFWDKDTYYPWHKVFSVRQIPDPSKDPGR